ncbi:uncharacterized protein LOC143040217 isoform X2 [Oratosquilla oratoria]|uniref:uncharacterized protein LOC143040217 isoform X2 n=1 Tax=Oratosquilla oratoria TaxID=337810 RepID=UPI003F76512E
MTDRAQEQNFEPPSGSHDLRDVVSLILVTKSEDDKLKFLMEQKNVNYRWSFSDIPPEKVWGLPRQQVHRHTLSHVKSFEEEARDILYSIIGKTESKLSLVCQVITGIPSQCCKIQHFIFSSFVKEQKLVKVCNTNWYQLFSLETLKSEVKNLERKKLVTIAEHVQAMSTGTNQDDQLGSILMELTPALVWIDKSEDEMTGYDKLIRSPGYKQSDIEMIYEEFAWRSFPFTTVKLEDIGDLLQDLGWYGRESRVFSMSRNYGREVDLQSFVTALVAMDPTTQHGFEPAEIRCHHIFRYYNENCDDVLDSSEMKDMVHDIRRLQGKAVNTDQLNEEVREAFCVFSPHIDNQLTLAEFLNGVGQLRFRGTSLLYRSSSPVVKHIIHKNSRLKRALSPSLRRGKFMAKKVRPLSGGTRTIDNRKTTEPALDSDHENQSGFGSSISLSEGAFTSSSGGYVLARHTVKVRRSGIVTCVDSLLDLERAGEVTDTGFDSPNPIPGRSLDRFRSVDAFNQKSIPNEMLQALRFFENKKGDKPQMDWGEVDRARLGQYLISLCSAVKDALCSEPRLLRISAPCYILGDIHGNYHDLVCFEKALWRLGPLLTPANFLFLGDYVDRGEYGVEVVAYLFSQKLQDPKKIHLLRGNHEIREIQDCFSFHNDCWTRFGKQLGDEVWNAVNDVFDHMPVAAVVDEKIFCIHGGIPKLTGGLEEIYSIPCPLTRPEEESQLAWQLMWNDPVDSKDDDAMEELERNEGFALNTKRQTAYVFNKTAFSSFLEANGLTHVVRAHEVKQAGFEIQMSGKLLTVFSSSHYCGGSNEAACILVHDNRLRAIRLDTS